MHKVSRIIQPGIWFLLPDDEISNVQKSSYDQEITTIQWQDLSESYEEAKEKLRLYLNPAILDRLTHSC